MPIPSRCVVGCLKTNRVTPCANSTSTNASVRTLAAVVRRKQEPEFRRERTHEAGEQRRPPGPRDGAQNGAVAQRQKGRQKRGLDHQTDRQRERRGEHEIGKAKRQNRAAIADRRKGEHRPPEQGPINRRAHRAGARARLERDHDHAGSRDQDGGRQAASPCRRGRSGRTARPASARS